MKLNRDHSGMTLVQAMIGLALLGGLAVAVMNFSGYGLRSLFTADTKLGFETFTSSIQLLIENEIDCGKELGSAVITNNGKPASLGIGQITDFMVPGVGRVAVGDRGTIVGGYKVKAIELQTLKLLSSSDRGDEVIGIFRVSFDEAGPVLPTRALGQPLLMREFYVLATVQPSNGQVSSCVGGRGMAEEEVLLPNLISLPPGKGLNQVSRREPQKSGNQSAFSTYKCQNGIVVSAQTRCMLKDKGGQLVTPWMPFFPYGYTGVCAMEDANPAAPEMSGGRVIVNSDNYQEVTIFGGWSSVSNGAQGQWTCLELGDVK